MAEVQDVVSGLPEGKQEQALEAVLFAAGEPVELEVLARAFGMPTKQMQELLDNMRFSYNQQNRGIQMLRLGNAYQLCTRQEYAACVHAVFDKKREVSLSAAALEVLAIAAYNQPVTRAFLEQVRQKGAYLKEQILALRSPKVHGVRGMGLMLGISVDPDKQKEYVLQLMEKGVLVLTAGKDAIRLLPPLIITKEEIDRAVAAMKEVFA